MAWTIDKQRLRRNAYLHGVFAIALTLLMWAGAYWDSFGALVMAMLATFFWFGRQLVITAGANALANDMVYDYENPKMRGKANLYTVHMSKYARFNYKQSKVKQTKRYQALMLTFRTELVSCLFVLAILALFVGNLLALAALDILG